MNSENQNENQAVNENPQTAEEYVAAIKALKENSVPKSEFDKVVQEKQVLIRGIADGAALPDSDKPAENKPDIKQLREKIRNAGENNLSNAEFVQTALDLRDACLAEGLPDPFLPLGIKRKPDNQDLAGAEKVADAFKSMLEEAKDEEGKVDNDFFNALLKKYIANDNPILTAKLKNRK